MSFISVFRRNYMLRAAPLAFKSLWDVKHEMNSTFYWYMYCTISIDSAITRHRACGLGRIRSPVPRHNPYGRRLFMDPKWSKKAIYGCGSYATFFSTYLLKENTDWSMTNILEVQMLRYSKIMLGNCCNIWSSLLSSIMSCHQWVIRSPDWPDHSFWLPHFFPQYYHFMLYLLPLQSLMVGWI